jgi:hypothetical protein
MYGGEHRTRSPYRSEVAGLYGIATIIREICAFHQITAGTVYIGCGGIYALVNCTDPEYLRPQLLADIGYPSIPQVFAGHPR